MLAYETDDGPDPPVILLHEGAGSLRAWSRTRAALAGSRRLIAYDRRGFGRSPRTARFDVAHFDEACDDLVRLLERLDLPPADFVGHSDGGSVALLAAARHPELVRSVVVVATHVVADPATVAGVGALGPPGEWDERVRRSYAEQHGADWAEVVGRWQATWTTPGGVADWDMRAQLPAISRPVLAVHDRADPLSPALHAETIAAAVPGARTSWYDTGSHRPHLAEHDRFLREVRAFWSDSVR
jgi:pimeloyl-ACP methyl ester carboxylesterase